MSQHVAERSAVLFWLLCIYQVGTTFIWSEVFGHACALWCNDVFASSVLYLYIIICVNRHLPGVTCHACRSLTAVAASDISYYQ